MINITVTECKMSRPRAENKTSFNMPTNYQLRYPGRHRILVVLFNCVALHIFQAAHIVGTLLAVCGNC